MSVPPPNQHASTSTPPSTLQANQINGTHNNEESKPAELPPYERVDIEAIKQELHDLLGENGLPYWKALNGFLLGQLRRDELVSMVKKWLKGPNLQLHNNLLLGLLYNASIPTSSQNPSQRKRRRIEHDDPLFDIDETTIAAKSRVTSWVTGLTGKERNRIRRAVLSRDDDADGDDADDWDLRRRRVPTFTPTSSMPPLALSERQLPSAQQLSLRLGALAKAYDLTLAPDATTELGELLAVGIDSHLGDVFHNLVRLTGSDRHGVDTIHIPTGSGSGSSQGNDSVRTPYDDNYTERDDSSIRIKQERDLPKPDLNTLQHLFTMHPDSHQQSSPALYKLQTSQLHNTRVKDEPTSPPPQTDHDGENERSPPPRHTMIPATNTISPSKPMLSLSGTAKPSKAQITQERLINNELLKIDRGREEGEGKKDRKHNLHWKYEDPATIFKDILG